jgi:integrase
MTKQLFSGHRQVHIISKKVRRLAATTIDGLGAGRYHDGGRLYLHVSDLPAKDGNIHRTKRWEFRYTFAGRARYMGLGSYSAGITLAKARELADNARAKLQEGIDPIDERDRIRAQAAKQQRQDQQYAERTFGRAAEEWLKLKEPNWRSTIYREQTRRIVTRACAPIWKKPVSNITDDDVDGVLEPVFATTPKTARTLTMHVAGVLDLAEARKWRQGPNPARWGRLKWHFTAPSTDDVRHHPALPHAQAPDFAAALRSCDGVVAPALEFLLLTCTRTSDVIGATWPQVGSLDVPRPTWTIPQTKAIKDFRVPLSPRAVELLKQLPPIADNDHIFPGERLGCAINEGSMVKLLKRHLAPGYTVHGLRSTFKDWTRDTRHYDQELVEMCLAHRLGNRTEQAYARSDLFDKRAEIMADWADYLSQRPVERAAVVPMLRRQGITSTI